MKISGLSANEKSERIARLRKRISEDEARIREHDRRIADEKKAIKGLRTYIGTAKKTIAEYERA